MAKKATKKIKKRLEEIRVELRAERISYGELFELQSLAEYIEDGDVELLEPAGVKEKITVMINWTKVTDNEEVIRLIKEREKIEEQIRAIDEMALVRYELEALQ